MEKGIFIEWLNERLQERGWLAAELARRSGVSQSQISLVASGQRNPGPEFCRDVALAFGEDPVQVFRMVGYLPATPPPTDFTTAVYRAFRLLDEKQQNAVATLIFELAGGGQPALVTRASAQARGLRPIDVGKIGAVWDDVCTEMEYCGLLLHEDCADGGRIERHFRLLSSTLAKALLDTVGNREGADWAQYVHRLLEAHQRHSMEESIGSSPNEREPDG